MEWTSVLSFLTLIFEGYLFTGIIFGFPNLVLILKSEGVWTDCQQTSNLTADEPIDCIDKSDNFAMITTIAILAGNIMSLPLGIILDKFGTLLCRVACTFLITIGLISLFFVTKVPEILYLSIPALGAGGFTLLTTNFQLSLLTPMAALVVMAIQACFGASGTVFRLFVAGEISSFKAAGFLLISSIIVWIRTFFLMPKMWLKKSSENPLSLSEITPLKKSSSIEELKRKGVVWEDLKQSLLSPLFASFLYWFSIANSLITFYVSVLNPWAVWVTDGEESFLVNIFGILLALTIVFGPTGGLIIDGVTKCLRNHEKMTEKDRKIIGCTICILLNIVFGIAVCVLNCFKVSAAGISSMVLFQGHRIYTYGMAAAFLQSAFPQDQFGSLMGFGRLVIGLTSLVNLPLIKSITDGVGFQYAFIGYGVTVLTSSILPITACMTVRKNTLETFLPSDSESSSDNSSQHSDG